MNPRDLDRTSDLSVTVQLQPNALPAELLGDGSEDQRSSHGDRRAKLGRCGQDLCSEWGSMDCDNETCGRDWVYRV